MMISMTIYFRLIRLLDVYLVVPLFDGERARKGKPVAVDFEIGGPAVILD